MLTKAEAEATLAALPLKTFVAVADTTDAKTGAARRSFAFTLPAGNACVVTVDDKPTAAQLEDLAKHLPLDAKDRAAALETMKAEPVKVAEPAPVKNAAPAGKG
jgi:hypothetical protein